MGYDTDHVRGTIDELLRQETELRTADAETPDYVFFAITPGGKVVCGQPPMWGKYVLMAPWMVLDDDEPEYGGVPETRSAPVFFALNFGYGR
jgi:hypothetical protein